MYTIQTEKFSGPIAKLLELIEEKKLEVTSFSLAKVTADFLDFLKTLENVSPQILADFASVASKLILIKSRELLPELKLSDEEEAQIGDLEKQLQFYKEIRNAGQLIYSAWKKSLENSSSFYGRELFSGRQPLFYPPSNIDTESLFKAFKKIIEIVAKSELPQDSLKFTAISLEERIKDLVSKLQNTSKSTFSNLKNSKEKSELVVLFLAVLHLVRDRIINVRQGGMFEEIEILKIPNHKSQIPNKSKSTISKTVF